MANIVNYYEKMPKKLIRFYHNPTKSKLHIDIPFRMGIFGPPGAGKTNTLVNLVKLMSGTFNKLFVFTKNKHEALYEFLEEKIPDDLFFISEGYDAIPDKPEDLKVEPGDQVLVVFDDMVTEKKQKKIEEFFVRARKVVGGISTIYISQDYFSTPKKIRTSLDYVILKNLSSNKDLKLILREYGLGDIKTLMACYESAMENRMDFFMIDLKNPDYRYRRNFDYIY